MNLYYAITKEISITIFELEGHGSATEPGCIGNYFFAETRGKAKSQLIAYAKSEGERIDIRDIGGVALIAKNVDHTAGVCHYDDPLHPDYQRYLEMMAE